MLPKRAAILAGVTAGLVALSAFAQTPAPKKKKKPKHKTTAPAASAPAPSAPAPSPSPSPELYKPPPAEPEPAAPSPSAAPSSEPAPPPAEAPAPTVAEPSAPAETVETRALAPWSAAVFGGWGYEVAARFGFGARVGYTLPVHVYLGATFVYHLGESENGSAASFLYPGVEAGYELTFGPLLVRPYVGGGPLILHELIPPASSSTLYVAVWPGLTAAYRITPGFFVGGDIRYILSGYDFLGLFGTVGARF